MDQLDRAANVGDLNTATDTAIAAQYQDLITTVGNLRAEFAAVRIDIQQLGGDAQEIDALQAAFNELERKAREGTATAEDLNRVVALIGNSTAASVPGVASLSATLGGLATAFAQAAAQAAAFDKQRREALQQGPSLDSFSSNQKFIAEQQRINGLTAEQLALENEVARIKRSAERDEIPIGDQQALDLAKQTLAAEERRREIKKADTADNRAGAKAATEAEREAEAVVKLIQQLQLEYDLIGATNSERAVANALRTAGAAATETQRDKIEALINATYAETEAIKAADEVTKLWSDTLQSATRGFIDDLIEGKSAAEAFSNVLSSIANKLIDVGLNSVFSGFPGFGTPTRATGGPIYSGGPTLVGEKGPELFVPSGPGKIVPNSQIGGGGSVVFAPNIDARGADVAAVARLETAVQRLAAEVVPTIRKEIASGPKKGRS